MTETMCLEVDRDDIATLLQRKPHAGMDMLTVLGRQFHASQQLVRVRASRNPNDVIEDDMTFGERIADRVASFGGSWTFIITFALAITVYTAVNIVLRGKAWDPYPFILLNLFLSMLAAIQAPVIMMSQNRQDTKDRLRGELDLRCQPPRRVGDSRPGPQNEFAGRKDRRCRRFDPAEDHVGTDASSVRRSAAPRVWRNILSPLRGSHHLRPADPGLAPGATFSRRSAAGARDTLRSALDHFRSRRSNLKLYLLLA